jgi:hypothetical protein
MSEGVTGSAGCGGRLISVGVVMLRLDLGIRRQFRESLEGGCLGVEQVMLEKLKGRVAQKDCPEALDSVVSFVVKNGLP